MNYSQLSTVLTVLSSVQYQEIRLINQLNDFYGFDENIFLIDSLTDTNRFVGATDQRNAMPIRLIRFNASDYGIDGMKSLTKIQSKDPLLIIVIDGVCWDCWPSFRQRLMEIHRMQRNLKICLFTSPQFSGQDELHNFFLWCWNHGIVNIFVATFDRKVEPVLSSFSFDPFVNFRVISITDDGHIARYFPHQHVNYHLHTLRFPGIYQFSKEIIDFLSRAMNASQTFNQHPSQIDIIPGLDLYPRSSGLNTYPIIMENVVIAVPESLPFPGFSSYFRFMTENIFGWFLGVSGVVISLLTIIRYNNRKKIEIFQSSVDVLNLLLGGKSGLKYEKVALAETTLILPLTFAGLLIVNVILSELLSFLTQPRLQPEINSIEELYESKVKILVTPGYWEKEVVHILNDQFYQDDWKSRMLVLNGDSMDKLILSRNSSIAFISYRAQAQSLFEAQKRLGLRGYRIPTKVIVFMKKLFNFWVNENFPFIERFNEICHWLQHSGLYGKWEKDRIFSHSRMVRINIKKDSQNEEPPIPLVIVQGWIVSVLVFVAEILWKRVTLCFSTR